MTTATMILPPALRNTALTVTGLADQARPVTFGPFRARCLAHVARLREELRAAGHPPEVAEDAVYAQCALLDEVALRRLEGSDRQTWEHEPLQVREFQSHDAGQALIARIERRLAEPQPVLPLLAVFHAVLALGFQGRFALEGASDRAALMGAIDDRLKRAGLADATGPVIVTSGKARGWDGLTPLAWVALTCLGAGLVYLALDRWLAASIARLAG
ncbi:DotU/TssL family secretion system protein [Cupriavidus basilensis]|uniref:DotU/TssL family secretion system protein n=1 Tax=Cupriavidus basilensis TaxID=68895 RepID=A0ABT6AI11_9BURK|nr:DotU/TssL family secretion system protein [Cupriavidus basilensis]MDF3832244.1 DotU/TssL family secretion system protein [Cupriavidus basilensis]